MAERLGMSLDEAMESHTDRQLAQWLTYFNLDLSRPGKTEYHLMSVACEVRRIPPSIFGGKPGSIQLKDVALSFEEGGRKKSASNAELYKQPWIASAVGTGGEGIIERRRSRAEAAAIVDKSREEQQALFSRFRG